MTHRLRAPSPFPRAACAPLRSACRSLLVGAVALASGLAFGVAGSAVARADEPPPLPPAEAEPPPLPPPEPQPPLPPPVPQRAPAAPLPPAGTPLPPPSTPLPAVTATPPAVVSAPTLAAPPREILAWDPETPVPDGYVLRSNPDTGLIFAGSTLASIGWVTSVAVGLIAAKDETDRGLDGDGVEAEDWTPLYVPVVGPFIAISSVDARGKGVGLLMVDGALQLAGVGLIVYGSLAQSYRAVRTSPLSAMPVAVIPTVSSHSQGILLEGAF